MERYRAETPLDMARRHVREAEQRIARITRHAIDVRALGYDTNEVERLLHNFRELLELSRRHLEREEEKAARFTSARDFLSGDVRQRYKVLEARCSDYAAEFLRQIKIHPSLPFVIDRLEKISGPIYRTDVEQAYLYATDEAKL